MSLGSSESPSEIRATDSVKRSIRHRQPTRRRKRFVLIGLGSACAAFLLASYLLFVNPPTDQPTHVDGILSLDGLDEQTRAATAVRLAKEGYASTLLFSQGNYRSTPCPKVPGIVVVCFEPKPSRTIGEVEFAARYAHAHDWKSIMVVPGRAQSVRARVLMERCFSGRVVVVPSSGSVGHLPYEIAYEWGALTRAVLVDRNC